MKANELMIGDLVLFLGHIHQIRAIEHKPEDNFSTIKFYGKNKVITTTNEVEPIPLTTAILEKNGFRRMNLKDGAFEHVLADDYFDISVDEWSDSIWRVRYDCTEMQTPHEQITCSYVHELQHFLKKRTSEELSENFKA